MWFSVESCCFCYCRNCWNKLSIILLKLWNIVFWVKTDTVSCCWCYNIYNFVSYDFNLLATIREYGECSFGFGLSIITWVKVEDLGSHDEVTWRSFCVAILWTPWMVSLCCVAVSHHIDDCNDLICIKMMLFESW